MEYDYENLTIKLWEPDDVPPGQYESQTVFLAKMATCSRCEGGGSHTNPSIDGNGLSEEYMDNIDFMHEYATGMYDVQCHGCRGKKERLVVDYDNLTDAMKKEWADHMESVWRDEREAEDERRNCGL